MQKRCSAGEFGLTGKCWMLYARDIDLIHQFHSVININDYCLRLENWEELMVLSFTMNKQNYARYGTYNLTQMASLDSTHPWVREEMQEKGIWFCRNNNGIRQSIDGTGEQIFEELKNCRKNFWFLMCFGETFSEEANILLFAILVPHEIVLSPTTGVSTRNCLISSHRNLSHLGL